MSPALLEEKWPKTHTHMLDRFDTSLSAFDGGAMLRPAMEALLEKLVNIDSPTHSTAGVNAVADAVEAHLRAAGVEVMYTLIRNLTKDGRDRSLDYKITGFSVPPGSWDGEVIDAEVVEDDKK